MHMPRSLLPLVALEIPAPKALAGPGSARRGLGTPLLRLLLRLRRLRLLLGPQVRPPTGGRLGIPQAVGSEK